MQIPFVDLAAQFRSIQIELDRAISAVISESAFIGGKYVHRFEEAFASYCRAENCIGVGNGTDALYIALRAAGIGPGDEVITTANSFIATSEAITMTGARVVFVDCDALTYNMDMKKVPNAVTARTKAIIPVHLYGQPADMETLGDIANKFGLLIIEDAAQAHGAELKGQRVGTFGRLGCFSFYPGKNLGAYGDAGAIVTNDAELAKQCRMIANHGRIGKYDHDFEGINSRLDGLQSAILYVKLQYLEAWTEKRRAIASRYCELLRNSTIVTPVEVTNGRHVYHLYVVRIPNRNAVHEKLKTVGIESGIHYPIALPNLRAYRHLGYKPDDFPVATACSREILSLPMFPELSDEQIQYVCHHLKNTVRELGE
ncbi:MAG: DegT/DnrJ/EryC1/StrS family aminotransferase [Deltaproteobacteria bacterium]|nr:MAG: DegT/DnrJ/EryC1/StrS family aminotransferase [Deltaproteobacteria bacterium]